MFEIRKELLKGRIKLRRNFNVESIRKKDFITLLEQEREKTSNKEDFNNLIYTLPGIRAINISNTKNNLIEIYYEDENYFRKKAEVIISDNNTLRMALIEIFNSLTNSKMLIH